MGRSYASYTSGRGTTRCIFNSSIVADVYSYHGDDRFTKSEKVERAIKLYVHVKMFLANMFISTCLGYNSHLWSKSMQGE